MILKGVVFFLIGMIVLGMFGKLRWPGRTGRTHKTAVRGKCPACGAHLIGQGPCVCGHGGGKQ